MGNSKHLADCGRVKAIDALSKDPSESVTGELAYSLLQYENSLYHPESALCQRGLSGPGKALPRLKKAREMDPGDYLVSVHEYWFKEYEACQQGTDHKERREKLEEIISFLMPFKQTGDHRLLNLLARAYLHRSLLYRPKGFAVPARKIEGLAKAMALASEVLESDDSDIKALQTYGMAGLERMRAGKAVPEDFKSRLEDAALFIEENGVESPTDIAILLKYAELNSDGSYLEMIAAETRDWERPFDLSLFKAQAARLSHKPDQTKAHVEASLKKAPKALADPFWDDLVGLIKSLWEKRAESGWESVWKTAATQAHEKCSQIEASIGNNIYLSWYWSQQQPLYDLAFLAQESPEKRAKIADSLKSRTVLRHQALQELERKGLDLGEFLKQEYENRDGRYLKKAPLSVVSGSKRTPPRFDLLPRPWIGVHFYLNELEKQGYALIHDTEHETWTEKSFSYTRLYHHFLQWQESYIQADLPQRARELVLLCRQMGQSLDFLFDESLFPEDRPVLFVPHGFLHHLPLHAAISPSDAVFLEGHVSRYLPAWHMAAKNAEPKGAERIILKNFESDFPKLEKLDAKFIKEARPADLRDALAQVPGLLTLLCHGEGDYLNPFRSCLKLKDGDMSILKLLEAKSDLSGARVLLGACESDMAPPQGNVVDEHLSLSTLFLSQNAGEVVAGLWRIAPEKVNECYPKLCDPAQDMGESLKAWQEVYVEEFRGEGDDIALYHLAPFRVMGLPA